uniref:GcrA cell cycle regulator n=1 Tax=Ochrobactrum sp. LM19 TaxID=1449781 RepID=A0A0D5A145_9HYPH|nr:hypothetical protein pLM19O2_p90 [Ochrobactrum sp. LM19]
MPRPTAGHTLHHLTGCQCRWPVNQADAGTLHLFCGAPTRPGFTWCDDHYLKGYSAPKKLSVSSDQTWPESQLSAAEST